MPAGLNTLVIILSTGKAKLKQNFQIPFYSSDTFEYSIPDGSEWVKELRTKHINNVKLNKPQSKRLPTYAFPEYKSTEFLRKYYPPGSGDIRL